MLIFKVEDRGAMLSTLEENLDVWVGPDEDIYFSLDVLFSFKSFLMDYPF